MSALRMSEPQAFALRGARPADLDACRALLQRCDSPLLGLERDFPNNDTGPAHYIVAVAGDVIVACAGVEEYDDIGLLRSVAVDAAARGHGLGARLVLDRLVYARARGLASLWLLTTTASEYFPRLGFTAAERAAVPPAIQRSVEFVRCCPASAVCMVHRLGA